MSPARFLDPTGERYGIPTYGWGWAKAFDPDLLTRSQLRAQGLRPGGQQPVAQLMWRSRRARDRSGIRIAYLYDRRRAAPVRPMTPARREALAAAMRARRTCPTCETVYPWCIPTSLGECPACAGLEARAA
ncbi:RRQRL motif-containing zinc-binding protein [Marinactinospora rubrisoli]|uniref:RRQRL motif-containing zinc-binding protein n=1 Tax=Marinactinospora rubrisoli TaxID=2715399 RepID=A0ABW2KND4_9ACTN